MRLLWELLGVVSAAAVNSVSSHVPATAPEHVRYVIVGAGPGGLQLAHYFDSAGRDYVVLERNAGPGSFFERLPRFRQLISINKRFSGRDELDHLMRHDWNSLLSDRSHSAAGPLSSTRLNLTLASAQLDGWLLFREYSEEYFPHADTLVAYLRDWAGGTGPAPNTGVGGGVSAARRRTRAAPLRVLYNTSVDRIQVLPFAAQEAGKHRGNPLTPRFRLFLSGGSELTCTFLVLATGLQEVVTPTGINVAEAIAEGWVQLYHNASTDLSTYAGKRVMLLGRGNAAFEFANKLIEVTTAVHMVGRSSGRLRLAVETHYPGDIRAVHSHLLESYQLKSQDTIVEAPFEHLRFHRDNATGLISVEDVYAPCGNDAFGRDSLRCVFRESVDSVIVAPGWRFSTALFDTDGPVPQMHRNGKHPATRGGGYESANIPGLYFAGTASHGNDHKVSSGGFIHGFRYLCRALHRELEQEEVDDDAAAAGRSTGVTVKADGSTNAGVVRPWLAAAGRAGILGVPCLTALQPHTPQSWPRSRLKCGLRGLVTALLRRVNLAAGPFQVFGGLADVVLLSPIHASDAVGFSGAGPLSALYEPWSFPYSDAECAATAGADEFAPLWLAQPPDEPSSPHAPLQSVSDAAISRALHGALFEEVPTGAVPTYVRRWAREEEAGRLHGRTGGDESSSNASAAVPPPLPSSLEWITLTMEYGKPEHATPEGERSRDPFSRSRGNSNLRVPEASHFLHPILRFYRQSSADTSGDGTHAELVSELHIIEDAALEWTLHVPHYLALARWLQEVGSLRAAAALAAAGSESLPAAAAVVTVPASIARRASRWQPPTRPMLLDWLMRLPGTMLYYRGAAVWGGADTWFTAFSTAVANVELCVTADISRCTGIDFVAIHALPAAATEAGAAAVSRGPLDALYRELTAGSPGLAVLVFPVPRRGLGSERAAALGLSGIEHEETVLLCAGSGTTAADAVGAAAAATGTTLTPLNFAGGVALRVPVDRGGTGPAGDTDSSASCAMKAVWHDAVARAAKRAALAAATAVPQAGKD